MPIDDPENDAEHGRYLPGPPGSRGDFWVGDTVRVHTGFGPFDYTETDWKVQAITITREDDNHELDIIVELVSPVVVPPTGDYMLSFLIQRSDSSFGADVVPRGTDDGGVTYSDPFTWLGGALLYPTGPLTGYPMDVAYLEVGPTHAQWIWGPSVNGTGYHMILTGATGPPVYLGDYPTTPGYVPALPVQSSPTVVAPDDGIMFCLTEGVRAGDVGLGNWVVTGPSGVVTLRQTMQGDIPLGDPGGDTFPNSILVYKMVTASESVTFVFTDSGTKQYVNSLVVFVPGDVVIDTFTHSGSILGGLLSWSW